MARLNFSHLVKVWPELSDIGSKIQAQISADALYEAYVTRQNSGIAALERDYARKIPTSFQYGGLPGLSNELCGKLELVRPESLDQANRIEGMTPSALMVILAKLRVLELRNAG